MSDTQSISAGESIEFRAFPAVTQDQLKRYANASGDQNPIHQDESVAKAMGLPGVIAHGMLSMAIIGERALDFVEEHPALKGFRIRDFQSRFKAMVQLGDQVSVGGTVKELAGDRMKLELQARNQRGETVTLASLEFTRS